MEKANQLEHDVQNEIRIWCGEHDLIAFRVNVVSGYTPDGRRITTGVPRGFPDLMVLDDMGHTVYVECKTLTGRAREDQKRLHEELRRRNHVVLMPRSLEQFEREIAKHLHISGNAEGE